MKENLEFGYVSHNGHIDPYYHTKLIEDWEFSYHQVSSGKFIGNLSKIWLGDIEIYEEKLSTAVFQEGCCQQGVLCIGIFRNFQSPAICLGHTVENSDIISIRPNQEILIKTPEESKFYALQIPLQSLVGDDIEQLEDMMSLSRNAELNNKIYNKIRFLFNAFENIVLNEVAKKDIISDFTDIGCEYINSIRNDKLEHKKAKNKAERVIKKILYYLQSTSDLPITVEDFCKVTNTSRRTLQNYFEIIIGCSPSLFLKYWKLNCARKMLLANEEKTTVSQVASYWGFWHFSQFAQDYKGLFGELPSTTLELSR
ncbi:helix-turn-helix domain-containing protein [Acinetobacter sp. YK3]|uniref:helix-turn-helix domain-containing protein n=1 Tax=Acinetobacter sp. YK3 TaxID=1860097 RepID=UPI00084C241C|nr:helix-turn-helix domain-containing protein [Acinetobacter sp. YK3]OEC90654.1 hypothetical protein A9Z07_03365 [Acinetobacter sp. YK3]